MSTISVRPLSCVLERGAGLPALQVTVEIAERPDATRLLLGEAVLASWPGSVARSVARLPVGEQTRPDGVAVRVAALGAGGLLTVLARDRFLLSLEFGPGGALRGACVARTASGPGPTTA